MAAPEAERALFERPGDFRRMQVRLGDPFTVHGASCVRPPISPILEEGYVCAGEFPSRLQPDIMVGGHSFVIEREPPSKGAIQMPVQVTVSQAIATGVHMVALDVTVAGDRHGPLFDFIIGIDRN